MKYIYHKVKPRNGVEYRIGIVDLEYSLFSVPSPTLTTLIRLTYFLSILTALPMLPK
jgi:hypothetical protein